MRFDPAATHRESPKPVIPVSESRRMAEALKNEEADAKLVEFAGAGHNSWDRAYGDAELWQWLFRQTRRR